MISKQIWKPDTCKCVIEQSFDYSNDPATLVEQVALELCEHHSHPDEVLAENKEKNVFVDTKAKELGIKPEEVKWEFDKDRKVIVK